MTRSSEIEPVLLQVALDRRERLRPIWSFGVNTCHAPLWLRDDLNRHLDLAARELGMTHVRAHGTLGDNMGTVTPSGSFNFDRLLMGLDRLLDHGLRPFLELSHMPSDMASSDASVCLYRFRSAPPKDWGRWRAMIEALARTLLARYGLDELRRWYFEVWNEPDIPFWTGTQEQYFRLYDLAADAIKSVHPDLCVGGPATSKTAWIGDFVDHVARPSDAYRLDVPRCDFVSTHAYPSDLAFLDGATGSVALQNSNIMRELFAAARARVTATLGEGVPLFCGEWNSSAGPLAANHDDCNNAAFVAKTLVELSPICDGSLFWNLSDIYEECGFHHEPFHGGYGLLTVNDIRKSAFHAFAWLHEHSGQRCDVSFSPEAPGLGALASVDGDHLRLLIYFYREPETRPVTQRVEVTGLPDDAGDVQVRSVRPGQGSAFERWVELGSPPYANRPLLEQLEQASRPARSTLSRPRIDVEPGTIHQLDIRLR